MHEDIKETICKEIQRLAWRLQYYARKEMNQYPFTYDFTREESFEEQLLLKLYIQELMNSIRKGSGKKVIYSLFFEGKTVKEISTDMKISVQAVNKWKRKTIQELKGNISLR